ncbi:MAG: endonuclease/exonuclease/phosphatase family protein [Candidatus Pseudobacter hemicellulosilyticus]|uniref:Endonuclease/exonuclease/phosphatase family protein n=1 Tax=Candidatus Pseudobacter hemicellulosilyticus TaxID=3121375 RepID=A0AAJ5WRR3_9BACT|nr:MAG: endonuclease/exonuclease/phosphatase family protein [Pseudobacter sp.]
MKNNNPFLFTAIIMIIIAMQACKVSHSKVKKQVQATVDLSVMQFNAWGAGDGVDKYRNLRAGSGFEAIVDEIAAHDPDVVTLSEVNGPSAKKIIEALAKKGKTYYTFTTTRNPSIISRYPITYNSSINHFRSNPETDPTHGLCKLIIKVKDHEVAVYSGHLDYTNYACYLPRGYDGVSWSALSAPVTDPGKILAQNAGSTRASNIQDFIDSAKADIARNRTVILGGDFNEPSHLDWTENTKNLFDHNGVVVPWPVSKALKENGFIDSYRAMYPNEVDYPGFTWVAQKSWTPLSDERDRIDFIYYYARNNITLTSSVIVGPKESIVKDKPVAETSKDRFLLPVGIWPTDHKAVLSKFKIQLPGE